LKQIIQNYKGGDIKIEEVPAPSLKPGGILVKNSASLISAGTEKYIVNLAQSSLASKAKQRPDLVKQVIEKAKKDGIISTVKRVKGKLDSALPLGYSSAGEVIEIGSEVKDINVGDKVACAGGTAGHGEVNYVPKNLYAKVPDNVTCDSAAFTTVAAIALQGIRQADPKLGDNVAVIGLGLIGQITIQLLKANGCNVIGIDVDKKAVIESRNQGADLSLHRDDDNITGKIESFTNGYGVDSILITAGTDSDDPINFAGKIARDRATIVAVGLVNLDVPRNLFYEKELEVKLSRSYGPGRYDPQYEEKGFDYPLGYVRWTETRNMEAVLELLSQNKLNFDDLITHRFPIEEADKAYDMILNNTEDYTGVLLEYEEDKEINEVVNLTRETAAKSKADNVNAGVIGAGNFAQATLLPAMQKVNKINLQGLATSSGVSAKEAGSKFGFSFCTSDYTRLLETENINTIFILTRHNTHAELVKKALQHDKHVFVEKPLALNEEELMEIAAVYQSKAKLKNLMIGFNRRFSPYTNSIKKQLTKRSTPLMINYQVNAGYIPEDHWVHDPEVGGGRIKGEVCHFIDLLVYLTDSMPVKIHTESISTSSSNIFNDDNVSVTLHFDDGSVGNILYTAMGDGSYPKEKMTVFGDSKTFELNNYRKLYSFSNGKKSKESSFSQKKGFQEELKCFADSIFKGENSPIDFREAVASSLATLKAVESYKKGQPVKIAVDEFLCESRDEIGSE